MASRNADALTHYERQLLSFSRTTTRKTRAPCLRLETWRNKFLRLAQTYTWEEGQYASFVSSSLWSPEHDKLISASAQVLNLYKLYHFKLFTPQNRLMPYQTYPFHRPLIHWPQRAYDPRVVADGFKCKTSGNFPSESCDRWRQTGESQEPWNPFHGIFLQLLHLCRGSLRVKGEKIEVNKMKNHDGSHTWLDLDLCIFI